MNSKFRIQSSELKKGISFIFSLSFLVLFVACSDFGDRDNPLDPAADNYVVLEESSSSVKSSSSVYIYSAGKNSSSSNKKAGSSSSTKGSSSSVKNNAPETLSYGKLEDSRDGKTYKTIVIGSQNWMAENLNYKVKNSYCYDDDDSYCDKYGRLYTLTSAENLCPEGWRLPTRDDFEDLLDYVGSVNNLKAEKGSGSYYEETNNVYGFTAYAVGGRYDCGDEGIFYYSGGWCSQFWTSTKAEFGMTYAMLICGNDSLAWAEDYETNAFSIRCIEGKLPSSSSAKGSSSSEESASEESSSSSGTKKSSSSVFSIEEYLNPNISYGEITDGRDGQVYKTVVIGRLTWMAQNLNFETENSVCQDDKEENCARLGRLYMWNDAIDSAGKYGDKGKGCGNKTLCETPAYEMIRGICPKGFHLPTAAEFSQLISIAGADVIKIKSQKTWKITGTDDFGFSAVQSGRKIKDIWHPGEAFMWSTSQVNKFAARALQAVEGEGWGPLLDVSGGSSKDEFYSVRCLQDYEVFGTLTDERDDKVYKTAKIGSQNWMIENLNYAYVQRTKTEDSSSFCLNNLPENCDKYGRLYLWSAAMDSAALFSESGKMCGDQDECSPSYPVRGVCPKGWHLPTSEDFKELGAGGGYALKSKSGWINGENGSDYYGFNAYPAGAKGFVGDDCTNALGYDKCENSVDYWSATEHDYASALRFGIMGDDNNDAKQTTTEGKVYALSVRCIED